MGEDRLGGDQAGGAGRDDVSGNSGAIAGNVHTPDIGLQVIAGFNLGCEKLDFRRLQEGFVVVNAGDDVVEFIQTLDDVGQNPFGQRHGLIPANHVRDGSI